MRCARYEYIIANPLLRYNVYILVYPYLYYVLELNSFSVYPPHFFEYVTLCMVLKQYILFRNVLDVIYVLSLTKLLCISSAFHNIIALKKRVKNLVQISWLLLILWTKIRIRIGVDMPILFTDKIDCYAGLLRRNSSVMCHYIKFVPWWKKKLYLRLWLK